MQQCMLGAMDEFCTMLVPSMHCSMIFFIFLFFFIFPIDWNNLPADIRSITSFKMFKQTLLSYFTLNCTCYF